MRPALEGEVARPGRIRNSKEAQHTGCFDRVLDRRTLSGSCSTCTFFVRLPEYCNFLASFSTSYSFGNGRSSLRPSMQGWKNFLIFFLFIPQLTHVRLKIRRSGPLDCLLRQD
jgi:hypothetical protein